MRENREKNQTRELKIDPFFLNAVEYSVLISIGNTKVICAATLEKGVPRWLKGKGKGWVTAEYGMLPKSTEERIRRERKSVSGRTQEIQRLIGRSLRAGVDMEVLGERQITIDCDVIQADGGTRTASITGGFVALSLLINDLLKKKILKKNPIISNVMAISCGIVEDKQLLDLQYTEDSAAQVDMNVVVNGEGNLIEVQGTGEERAFSQKELNNLVDLAIASIPQIKKTQDDAIKLWESNRKKTENLKRDEPLSFSLGAKLETK